MTLQTIFKRCAIVALLIPIWGFSSGRAYCAQPGGADVKETGQVLTRGPVHEAFAETLAFDPQPGIVVPTPPPADIEELPPDQKPEGENVAWVPGYWGWDDERNDFVWISGIWRVLPPGRQWVPGYWGKSGNGFQWTSGYWADSNASEVEYLPEPPESAEAGPNVPAPSANSTWLPGCWIWHENRYAWRPGFWADVQPNWVWIPDHYVWAPRGYVFVNGYWDYAIGRRGVLFAPVYFDRGLYARPGFSFSPAIVIDLNVFANHLFLRPKFRHYYFGDYYAASYQNVGFVPWFLFLSSRRGYDPIYAHQRWQFRNDPQWEHRVAASFRLRRDQEDARPPRTLAAQRSLIARGVNLTERGFVMAEPLEQQVSSKDNLRRFQTLDTESRQQLAHSRHEVERIREERRKMEFTNEGRIIEKPSRESVPVKVELPDSPITARRLSEPGPEGVPPKIRGVPQPDLQVAPKPRRELKDKADGVLRGKASDELKGEAGGEFKGKAGGESKGKAGGELKGRAGGESKGKAEK